MRSWPGLSVTIGGDSRRRSPLLGMRRDRRPQGLSERHELPGWAQCAWTWPPTEAGQRSDGGAVRERFKVKDIVVRDLVSDLAPLEPPRVAQGALSDVSIVLDDGG